MAIYFFSCAGSVSAFATERMEVSHSLMGTVFILIRKFEVVHCLSNYFSSTKIIFKKRLAPAVFFQRNYNYFHIILATIHFFNVTVRFSDVTICSYPVLSTHFLSVYFTAPVTVKQISYQSNYIFRAASIILKWEQLFKQYFSAERFFSEYRGCLE